MADTTLTKTPSAVRRRFDIGDFVRQYGVLIIIAVMLLALTMLSPSFLTPVIWCTSITRMSCDRSWSTRRPR